ncbi:ABC transporter ATP-binding protein [Pseudofrankia sp. DC12]|uniref:ABC transporter ATP-binding protein n=1 Tax=Pseudofrankia sp. DC12 TaxID=683315 RepID=UPI0005F767D8|nr:ABC transporter ATP-binding protein [Pseudofrankia sp. DC12]
MLTLHSVTAGYGGSTVLRDVDFTVGAGEVVALLGPNGAGKSTLLRLATGFVTPESGRVELDGDDVTGQAPHQLARRGVCLLPESRGVFPSLTVLDNLRIQAGQRAVRETVAELGELFPALTGRLNQTAGSLSGGEQQMLALFRAYVTRPKVVLVDEASLGLAPLVIDKIYDSLGRLVERGMSVVIVEQYVHRVLELARTVYVLRRGEVVHAGAAAEITPAEVYEKYLGLEEGVA